MKYKPIPILLFLFLSTLLASAYAQPFAAQKDVPKIEIWDLTAENINPSYAQDLTNILVSEISKLKKYEVYSRENVRTLASWTAERMTLGCTDTKCLTALGQTDIARLISARVGKIGNRYSVSLNLFDSQNGKAEKTIADFCRSQDELIGSDQLAVRRDNSAIETPPLIVAWQKAPENALRNIFSFLKEYAQLISAVLTLGAILVSLYLSSWKAKIERPKLKLFFNNNLKYPYFQELAFEPYQMASINFDGVDLDLYRPGFNLRVKIKNDGKTTAKKVQARVEKIVFFDAHGKLTNVNYYHPTTIKWSGERDWNAVDIMPHSHFFLDTFWIKNETTRYVIDFNHKMHPGIKKDLLETIIKTKINARNDIYWNIWVDNSYDRGIPVNFRIEGKMVIYFIVIAENCKAIRFESLIILSFENWNSPQIEIRQNKKIINNDEEGEG